MTLEQNIRAVIESCFSESKEEIQNLATTQIVELIKKSDDVQTQVEEKTQKPRTRKKTEEKKTRDEAWEFHWDGRGSYEEAYRCFYGDFG